MLAFDGRLHVHYGQAYVFSGSTRGDTGDMEACFRGQSNGLLGAAQDGMLFLITGLHTGQVGFTLEVAESEPPPIDDSWEECVETGYAPEGDDARLVDWDGRVVCQLRLDGPDYRVRYSARGMDAGREADTVMEDEELVDFYRLSFWPSPAAPDCVIKQTSEIARYWHNWAGRL